MPQGVPKKKNPKETNLWAVESERMLRDFDMMTEDQVAILLDVDVKTLKNRQPSDLPRHSKVGAKRLFF
jgi:hypothetical protein